MSARKAALRAIEGQARMALQCNKQITELVRAHNLQIACPPDRPYLELLVRVGVLKHPKASAPDR